MLAYFAQYRCGAKVFSINKHKMPADFAQYRLMLAEFAQYQFCAKVLMVNQLSVESRIRLFPIQSL